MSVAIDANILVYRSNAASVHHQRAIEVLDELVSGDDLVHLFWPVTVAYLRVTTARGVLTPPLSLDQAMENIAQLVTAPNVRHGSEGPTFWARLRASASQVDARGKFIHDAHLVALMREHDVDTVWTHDRGFLRFRDLRVVDPFAPP